jgi:hypothetical protein
MELHSLTFPSLNTVGGTQEVIGSSSTIMEQYHLAIQTFNRLFAHVPHPMNFKQEDVRCHRCGEDRISLEFSWLSTQKERNADPLPFIHRCRDADTSRGGRCGCCPEFPWEDFCPEARIEWQEGIAGGNGNNCLQCDYTEQFCGFHRVTLPLTSKCYGCIRDARIGIILAIRVIPQTDSPEGTVKIMASQAIGGNILAEQLWNCSGRKFGDTWYHLGQWMQLLHAKLLLASEGPPRLCTDGQMRTFEQLRISQPAAEGQVGWLLAGLITGQIVYIIERESTSLSFRQNEVLAAAHEMAQLLHRMAPASPRDAGGEVVAPSCESI